MGVRAKYIFLFFLMYAVILKAQNINVGGVFPTIDHSGELTSKLEYGLYYFAALPLFNFNQTEFDPHFNLLYAEQALTYKKSERLSFTASYVYQRSDVVYDNYANENRLYLQAKYKHAIKKVNVTHRLRVDGRFIHNRTTDKTPFTHRARYLIGMDVPINTSLYFTAYEEGFFNTFKNASAVYAENWAYAALGKKLNTKNKIEVGVLYITWNLAPKSWFNQYYLQLTWINHLDFKKNKE